MRLYGIFTCLALLAGAVAAVPSPQSCESELACEPGFVALAAADAVVATPAKRMTNAQRLANGLPLHAPRTPRLSPLRSVSLTLF
jgi:hypothetical protein